MAANKACSSESQLRLITRITVFLVRVSRARHSTSCWLSSGGSELRSSTPISTGYAGNVSELRYLLSDTHSSLMPPPRLARV